MKDIIICVHEREVDLMNDRMSRREYKKLKGLGFLQSHRKSERDPALYKIGVCLACQLRPCECVEEI